MFAALRMFGSRARTVDAPVLSRLGLCFQNLSESFRVSFDFLIVPITISDLSLLKDLKELNTTTRKHRDVQLAVRPD